MADTDGPDTDRAGAARPRLRVDPLACIGVGICAHLAADIIRVDSWGFPIVSGQPLAGAHLRAARSAVAACPTRALFLDATARH